MPAPPPGGDLTGVWRCDDGGLYYVRQSADRSVTWAGLQDSGFHKGMEFTNVFRGSLSDDGQSITGEWADLPRGGTASSGSLVLSIKDDASGRRLLRVAGGTTGGFGGATWLATGAPLQPQDIVDVAGRVQRYDKPLGQNNPPCRDFTVMWGKVTPREGPSLPSPNTYCTFVTSGRGLSGELFGWGGDGDFTFDFETLWATQFPNGTDNGAFWNHGWLTRPVSGVAPVTLIARLYEQYAKFHCEAAMYGRENSGSDCAAPPRNLLPGWNERSGWSVLVNGVPLQGRVTTINASDPANLAFSFPVGPGGQAVELKPGAIARVTGVVAEDAGHDPTPPPEIHPVYAIDVQQDFKLARAQPVTLSGVWHGSDEGTYYIRQLGREIWWLGLSRDQGRSFANVFRGTIGESGPIVGEWIDIPMGVGGVLSGGSLTLQGDQADTQLAAKLTKTQQSATFGADVWTKIYDTQGAPVGPPTINPGTARL